MTRERYSSGAKWEPEVGYSRAIRVGDRILVAGTTAVDENGDVVGEGDAFEQARFAFAKCLAAVEALGGKAEDVVRTRMYVVDVAQNAESIGRAHRAAVGEAMPVATLVGVAALIDGRLLVEVEVEAVVSP